MKKVLSIVLALAMLVTMAASLAGCGGDDEAASGKLTVWGGINDGDVSSNAKDKEEYFHSVWEGYTDAEVEWIQGDIKMLMASGDYPDVLIKSAFQNQDIAKYAAQGIILPLDEYINEKDTPNIWRMFKEAPTTRATATSPDGHIYALPTYNGRPDSYVETYWHINKVWLDNLGLEVPTTLDELYDVLVAFKTKDPNGNGEADEIPFMFGNEQAYSYPETILSAWGVSTKFGMYDGWLNVVDGEVRFTPVLDEWKEMCKFYNKLWDEGLLDIESFTMDSSQYLSKLQSDQSLVGVTFLKSTGSLGNPDDYEVIKPISADGKITPIVHIHPGAIGTKNAAVVTSNCTDIKAAMKFLDGFYDIDQTIQNWYGRVGEGYTFAEKNADGMYVWNEPEEGQDEVALYLANTIWGPHVPGYMPLDSVGTLIESVPFFETDKENYTLYEEYIDTETWPRPYYSEADSTRINELLTDITTYVEQSKANFITGKTDIDEGWDEYIAQLEKLNYKEYLDINQRTYDVYYKAYNEMLKAK